MTGLRRMIEWAADRMKTGKTKAAINVAEAQAERLDRLMDEIRQAARGGADE